MITNIEFVKEVAKEKTHFISTGMTQYKEIESALEIFNENGCDYTLCIVSTYPTKTMNAILLGYKLYQKNINVRLVTVVMK